MLNKSCSVVLKSHRSLQMQMLLGCQRRTFANPQRLSNSEFFTRELKENPEFFKAFPHLQQVFDETKTQEYD